MGTFVSELIRRQFGTVWQVKICQPQCTGLGVKV